MNYKERQFLKNLSTFCTESMEWCARASEDATIKINTIINLLVSDAGRISAVSKETLDAINSMRELINNLGKTGNREVANELAKALNETAKHDQQLDSFVSPIIEALQFQDRITQNMANFSKITKIWLETRDHLEGIKKLSEKDLVDFGNKLLTCTTMIEERDLIRSKISGLKPEDPPKEVIFF